MVACRGVTWLCRAAAAGDLDVTAIDITWVSWGLSAGTLCSRQVVVVVVGVGEGRASGYIVRRVHDGLERARTGEAVQGRPEHARRTAQQVHELRLGQVMASRVQRVDDLGELGAGQAVRWAEEPLG